VRIRTTPRADAHAPRGERADSKEVAGSARARRCSPRSGA